MESTARGGGAKRWARGTPARRLALYGSHVGVGDVGALRLVQCALYSPTLGESHALTSSSGAEDPRRRERGREESVSRGDLRARDEDFSYEFVFKGPVSSNSVEKLIFVNFQKLFEFPLKNKN